ncbi:MAG: histidine phosphatase family protein [Roseovarius sp.]
MRELPPIWFLRHGQTEWNLEGRLQGHKDSPLTALGRAQAAQQARILPEILEKVARGAGGCFASPLGRAQETARIALAGRAFVTDPRLAEIATGDWEGRLRAEVATGEGDLFLYAGAPGGEGLDALQARVAAFLGDVKGPSVVVSHGLLGKVLRGQARGLDVPGMDRLSNLQGCVYLIENGKETVLEAP